MSVDYAELRNRHFADAMAQLPGQVARLDWSVEQIRVERDHRLGALLRLARERSPWHRRRLAGKDLEATASRTTRRDVERAGSQSMGGVGGRHARLFLPPRARDAPQ